MKVLMTGSGTGGHVYPALAIADTIKRHEPDSEIAFVGTSHGIENKLVPRQAIRCIMWKSRESAVLCHSPISKPRG